jgi:hypothetical protein
MKAFMLEVTGVSDNDEIENQKTSAAGGQTEKTQRLVTHLRGLD